LELKKIKNIIYKSLTFVLIYGAISFISIYITSIILNLYSTINFYNSFIKLIPTGINQSFLFLLVLFIFKNYNDKN
jgi:hypothetical protein